MDSTLNLLKAEINQTLESEHDLAKWKLAVTAALGAAAIGLGKDGKPEYLLFLFVPFVCAYIDLYAYQYQSRIAVLAKFLRENYESGNLLPKYEIECQKHRTAGVFSLGAYAGLGCSIGATVLGPIIYVVKNLDVLRTTGLGATHLIGGIVWLLGLGLIIGLWCYANAQTDLLKTVTPSETTPTTIASTKAA